MILINGNFLCRSLTGIERFAFEICKALDNLLSEEDAPSLEVSLLLPANSHTVPDFQNINLIPGMAITSFPKWDMLYFPKVCKRFKALPLNFSNTAPLGKSCGFAFLHDIYAKDHPEDFTTFRDRLIKLYSCLHYANIARKAKKIFTVSDFSKNQIQTAYNVADERISVIPNGWDHFKYIEEDDSIFQKFPLLVQKPFFFTLGSLQKRKNLNWIFKYAKEHPDQLFAVSGKAIGGMKTDTEGEVAQLKNILLLGYVNDGQVKSLLKRCRAFVFPSYYEGFGIPPLEALSAGAEIIISRSASLPEIYGGCAHYIDWDSTECNLNDILSEEVESPEYVLSKYTYENAAKKLLDAICGGTK